jgi:thioredoxin-like negative regulator of GroEL
MEQKRAKSDEFTECSDQDSTMFSADSLRESAASMDRSFRTLDQNEFFADIMAAPASDEVVFVHFNIQGSPVSEAIDCQLSIESKNHPHSKFVRIDASKAPFVARRLGTENDRPSVVALKDGKLINRISDFDSSDCLEIKQWMNTVEILKHFQQ